MTNYNERLYKILGIFSGGITGKGSDRGGYPTYFTEPYPIWCEARKTEATQAITSLIKELVAEVKPAMAIIYDNEMRIDRARKSAANHATDQFEQNLLKALEEK